MSIKLRLHTLWNGIRDNDGLELRAAESGQGRPAEDPMHTEGIDFASTGLVQPEKYFYNQVGNLV